MEVNKAIELLAKFKQEDSHEMFRDEEFDCIIESIKSLQAENKRLSGYKKMWKDLKRDYGGWGLSDFECIAENLRNVMKEEFEKEYLGGGE